jgi:hypothetical protein
MAGMKQTTYDHIVENLRNVKVDLETGELSTSVSLNKGIGYYMTSLGGRSVYVHHVVAIAGGLNPVGATVNHKDGDKSNNSFSNFEVLTSGDNLRDASKKGLLKGIIRADRFTEDQVREVHALLKQGVSIYKIGDMFGRSFRTIGDIKTGKTWSHVTGIEYRGGMSK